MDKNKKPLLERERVVGALVLASTGLIYGGAKISQAYKVNNEQQAPLEEKIHTVHINEIPYQLSTGIDYTIAINNSQQTVHHPTQGYIQPLQNNSEK